MQEKRLYESQPTSRTSSIKRIVKLDSIIPSQSMQQIQLQSTQQTYYKNQVFVPKNVVYLNNQKIKSSVIDLTNNMNQQNNEQRQQKLSLKNLLDSQISKQNNENFFSFDGRNQQNVKQPTPKNLQQNQQQNTIIQPITQRNFFQQNNQPENIFEKKSFFKKQENLPRLNQEKILSKENIPRLSSQTRIIYKEPRISEKRLIPQSNEQNTEMQNLYNEIQQLTKKNQQQLFDLNEKVYEIERLKAMMI